MFMAVGGMYTKERLVLFLTILTSQARIVYNVLSLYTENIDNHTDPSTSAQQCFELDASKPQFGINEKNSVFNQL